MKNMTMKHRNYRMTNEEEKYYALIKNYAHVLAPFYDFVTRPILQLRDKVEVFADAPIGSRILDVATGTGKQAFAFAKKATILLASTCLTTCSK